MSKADWAVWIAIAAFTWLSWGTLFGFFWSGLLIWVAVPAPPPLALLPLFMFIISMTAPYMPEFCATQDILVVSESKMGDYCELKQVLLDRELAAGNPYEPVMTECRLYAPENDEERLAPLEFEDEHD